ncbi:DUF4082 domain-containing protein [Actinokineospora inagensis]|uniref:DUF4082 domain-containing protein n=1 Tax=Actinokineospora inagensis TaxID=103730 RepID=UPI0004207C46|nr:DUF4082 domain-containing protein [Actinokineospora inagensis]
MRRLAALVFALPLLLLGQLPAHAAEPPTAWLDGLPDDTLVTAGQPITLHGHSAGVPGDGVKYTELADGDPNHYLVIAGAGQTDWTYTLTPNDWQVGPLTIWGRVVLDSFRTVALPLAHIRVGYPRTDPVTCPCSYLPASKSSGVYDEHHPMELGLKFFVDRPSTITGITYYGAAPSTGGTVGHLWSTDGTLVATTTSSPDPFHFTFDTPVALKPYATYVAAYTTTNGLYAASPGFFTSDVPRTSGPITAIGNPYAYGYGEGPGVYGNGGQYPRATYNVTSYEVTPIVVPTGG